MDSKHRKLPKSRKAMEYRVYWLERKLKHLKVSEHRKEHTVRIAGLPEGPVKNLMHLNNEFNQANERAAGLHNLTEELNRDTATLNERTERLHEVAAEKLATMDRSNRQSQRIQERGRLINKESLKTAAVSRAVTKASLDRSEQMQRQIEESAHLADLTRAQHAATDKLNQTTRGLNEETVKTTASSLKINRNLADTTETARNLNQKTAALQTELEELKAALLEQGETTGELNNFTQHRLEELGEVQQNCENLTEEARLFLEAGREQIELSRQISQKSSEANEACVSATADSKATRNALIAEFDKNQKSLTALSEDLTGQVTELLNQQTTQFESFCAETEQTVTNQTATHRRDLEAKIDKGLDSAKQSLSESLGQSANRLEAHLTDSAQQVDKLCTEASTHLQERTDQFNQDARLRFIALEDRTRRLSSEFSEDATHALNDFNQESHTRLVHADQLLETLSGDLKGNLDASKAYRAETESLLRQTRDCNTETAQLNEASKALLAQSQHAIGKVDEALNDVNNVSRKMFKETRELQDRTDRLNTASQHTAEELKTLNQQSIAIQSDSIKTQTLSQEINRHSLALNEETQRLQQDFGNMTQSNQRLVGELEVLKAELVTLSLQAEQQLQETQDATSATEAAEEQFQHLSGNTQRLNGQIEATVSRATALLSEVESQSISSVELFNRAENLTEELAHTQQTLQHQTEQAQTALNDANQAVREMHKTQVVLEDTADATRTVRENAQNCITTMEATHAETLDLNEATREFQDSMRHAVTEARQINDDFMRGLESLTRKNELTEQQSHDLLAETQSIQEEMNNILNLKHGIDGFQAAVDAGRNELANLAAKVEQCEEQSGSHERLVAQYQQRMEAYQADVTRYRESMLLLEKKFRAIDDQFQAQEVRLEDSEHQLHASIIEQRKQIEQMTEALQNNLQSQQTELEQTKQDLIADSAKIVDQLKSELEEDFQHRLEEVNRATSHQFNQTDGELRLLNSEVQQLNRSLLDEIATLKSETAAVNEQHALLRQEQVQQVSQQEFELDTLKQQLQNYQRLIETQLDDSPVEQLQQRIKQLENTLRQHQRSLKQQEAENEKPKTDPRVPALQQMVETLNRSLTDINTTNQELKQSLDETRNANQSLFKTNRELELSLATNRGELERCLERLHRLESREASLEETLSTIKNRESDTQETLQQMRNAVKDSTETMRETQRTLESLSSPDKKRDWLSPRQAVMSSVFAAALTGLSFFGYEEVNAAYNDPEPTQVNMAAPAVSAEAIAGPFSDNLLSQALQDLQIANESIVELGEFAWPVNFGIVDPGNIEYRQQHQGISISAELGDPVVAINDGTVVYSGNEIRGYGNMIVIQHDQDLLSVYANNQFNYVDDGDEVSRGQLIGDIGQLFNEDTAGLYFEIRRGGEPTDPFNYLRHHAENGSGHLEMLSAR